MCINLKKKTTATQPIYDGRIIQVRVDDVVLPNGASSKRELVKHPGAVAVIAVTDEGKIVLVEQYRKAMEKGACRNSSGQAGTRGSPACNGDAGAGRGNRIHM
ncbi:hypothetical protein GCM10020331_042270 [Ectobacillus funiculus]